MRPIESPRGYLWGERKFHPGKGKGRGKGDRGIIEVMRGRGRMKFVDISGTISPTTLEWIRKLVAVDTTSRRSNLALIELIRAEMASHALSPLVVSNTEGTKANLFVTIPAIDGTSAGGVMLAGHTDVVPVDGQVWSSDPFIAHIRDGKIYGRGACDMKAFIGVILAMLPAFLSARLRTPLHLAFTYDEEVGCHGAGVPLEQLEVQNIHPALYIVGEPTSMRVVTAHKSSHLFRVIVTGVASHSSNTPGGVNAIEYAAKAISFIRSIADEHRASGPFDPTFEVPFTTANVGVVSGGVAVNTVADLCEFEFEFRTIPGVEPAEMTDRIESYLLGELRTEMQQENDGADIRIIPLGAVPALRPGTGEALRLVRQLTGATLIGAPPIGDKAVVPAQDTSHDGTVGYGTEGGLFQLAGMDTVVCGPGSMEQGHTADEYIELSQVNACEDFMRKLIQHLSAG